MTQADADSRMAGLIASQSAQQAQFYRNSQSPVAAYVTTLHQATDDTDAAMQKIAVSGMEQLNTGLAEAIANGKNFGDTMRGVLKSLETQLLEMALQKLMANALGLGASGLGSLFGGGGGSGVGNLAMSAGKAALGFAEGGSFTVGGRSGTDSNLVPLRLSRGEHVEITPPGKVRAAGAGGHVTHTFNMVYDLRGSTGSQELDTKLRATAAATMDAVQRSMAGWSAQFQAERG